MQNGTLSDVVFWVFDLDNTLYPPEARLFDQIEVRMTNWVMSCLKVDRAEADRLRDQYWKAHGTTLAGLMEHHDIDPTPYLTDVHEIDLRHLERDAELAAAITNLPGRKIVYTNGSSRHALRVTEARGLAGVFDAIYGVEHANFRPKPERGAFESIFSLDGVDPKRAAMFEDEARNLQAPFEMGMKTIHVAKHKEPTDFIHHHTCDLTGFLRPLGVEI